LAQAIPKLARTNDPVLTHNNEGIGIGLQSSKFILNKYALVTNKNKIEITVISI
jgi:hypothetical protein